MKRDQFPIVCFCNLDIISMVCPLLKCILVVSIPVEYKCFQEGDGDRKQDFVAIRMSQPRKADWLWWRALVDLFDHRISQQIRMQWGTRKYKGHSE